MSNSYQKEGSPPPPGPKSINSNRSNENNMTTTTREPPSSPEQTGHAEMTRMDAPAIAAIAATSGASNGSKNYSSVGSTPPLPEQRVNQMTIDDAIDKLGMGRFQYRILLAAGLCFAADSMEVLLLSFLAVVLQAEWGLSNEQTATLTSSVFIGALLGTLVLGRLGDQWGRKPVFFLTASIICVFGFLTAAAHNFAVLVLIRFMVGFGVGGLTVPFDTLAEFVPNSHRGRNLLLIEYFWTAGTLLVPVLAFFSLGRGDNHGEHDANEWRIFVILCGIPCLISSICALIYVPESPRWLLTQNRHDEALDILREAAVLNGKNPDDLYPLETTRVFQGDDEESDDFCDLFRPEWLSTTLFLWATWAGFAFTYYGTIITVTQVFATEVDEHEQEGMYSFDYGAIFASASSEVAGTTLVLLTVDRVGRIPSQVVAYAGGGIMIFTLLFLSSRPDSEDSASRGILITTAFFARMFFMAGSCTTWVSTAEILTTEVRTTGHSSANAVARLSGAVSPFLVTSDTISQPVIGLVLLAISLITSLCSWHLPETKGAALGVHRHHDHHHHHHGGNNPHGSSDAGGPKNMAPLSVDSDKPSYGIV